MTADLKEMDSSVDFAELQQLRHIQSKLIGAHSTLKAMSKILETVESFDVVPQKNNELSKEGTLGLKCTGFLKCIEVLQQRLQSIARLVSDSLAGASRQLWLTGRSSRTDSTSRISRSQLTSPT
jgi:hypothetical protein